MTSDRARKDIKREQKGADRIENVVTNEEYNEEAERYRDTDSGKFTRGPRHGD